MQTVIVIPVYREVPLADEELSMLQTKKVLAAHTIVLIGPDTIGYSAYRSMGFESAQIMSLPAVHFENIHRYNKMLCSAWFYKLFEEYDYMLIFQNDAWVFRDEVDVWTSKGFDYIGSPWLWKPTIGESKPLIDLFFLMKNRVGNGGVSLRRIKTMRQKAWLATMLYQVLRKNEDFIWLLVNILSIRKMSKPDAMTALAFCVEMEPEAALGLLKGQLPFAVHAYVRYGSHFWPSYGVKIADAVNPES